MERLAAVRGTLGAPRIAVVKQDINEDLYCCWHGSSAREIVESTLLRTGPVDLFLEWDAAFLIVETAQDEECNIWQERATHLKWDTLEFFRSYRDRIPGRDYGQRRFAVPVEDVDWGQFDIVVSVDNSVPARITRKYPATLWTYYVREIKAPAYAVSQRAPLAGQDRVLNHYFRPLPPALPSHVLEFPYHLHSVGCFSRLFECPAVPDDQRRGVFVDHHTMVGLSEEARRGLQEFGPVSSPIHEGGREVVPTSERVARRTMDPDLRDALLTSRYYLVLPAQRRVFGTAAVEAIAAGCLVVGPPDALMNGFLLGGGMDGGDDGLTVVDRLRMLENDRTLRAARLRWQRACVNTLCCARPMADLLEAWAMKRERRG